MAVPNQIVFTPLTTITAQDHNDQMENVNSLADGSGIDNSAITTTHLADGAVTAGKTAFGGSYSTSEVNTGFTWIDGKTIYKRTYTLNTGTGQIYNYAHGISVSTPIKAEGTINGISLPLQVPYDDAYSVCVYMTLTNISLRRGPSGSTGTADITVWYTKA